MEHPKCHPILSSKSSLKVTQTTESGLVTLVLESIQSQTRPLGTGSCRDSTLVDGASLLQRVLEPGDPPHGGGGLSVFKYRRERRCWGLQGRDQWEVHAESWCLALRGQASEKRPTVHPCGELVLTCGPQILEWKGEFEVDL